MANTNEEMEYIDNVQLKVTEIELETSKVNEHEVSKVIFTTNKGRITHKPKTTESKYQAGLKVTRSVPCMVADLPKAITKMGLALQNAPHGIIVKATYTAWNTEKDGEQVIYRFINGKMIDKWEIVDAATLEVETIEG